MGDAIGSGARVLVTGASGFVGSHLAAALAGRGAQVTCLLRAGSDTRWLEGLALEVDRGGLEDPAALRRAVSGRQVVYHVAGAVKAADYAGFVRANADATEALLRACVEAPQPPRRFVLVSSLAALGPAPDGGAVRDDQPRNPVTDYGRSKVEAEQRALAYADRLEIAIVRPGPIYGPRDGEMLPLFRAAARGLLPALGGPGQRLNLAHVDDVVQGLLLAGERPGAPGGAFLLAGPREATMAEIAQAFGRAVGRRVRLVSVPRAVVQAAAVAAEGLARLRGKPALFSRQKVPELVLSWPIDLAAARTRLGYEPRVELEPGLAATCAWYRERGLL